MPTSELSYFTSEKIIELATEKQYDQKALQEFTRFLALTVEEEQQYTYEEEDVVSNVLAFVEKHMQLFEGQRQLGYSANWARAYAENTLVENHKNAVVYAYEASLATHRAQATADLTLYCQLHGKDAHFQRHFDFLVKTDFANPEPTVIAQAAVYSQLYKEQISQGKTDLFANRYADLMALDQYSELGCYAEAAEYERAILKGHNHDFFHALAMGMSEYIANEFPSYQKAAGSKAVDIERNRLQKKYQHLL
ncbi:hypothetical protein [Rufibacter quisquiliarum]|uniref:Uncharacterized protein n=1 Tax=Rufibacter quisquiliarum TaxID=1549639 RepID=A0A839GI11_9BACT|nr:hypothetical protein [Rufibacter quisquiliarum]MBA9078260.1 hypothetical protein [Rufibacter quisquiliarum]